MQADTTALAITSAALNLASGIVYTVSGALGTAASSLALLAAEYARATGYVYLYLSYESFAQVRAGQCGQQACMHAVLNECVEAARGQ